MVDYISFHVPAICWAMSQRNAVASLAHQEQQFAPLYTKSNLPSPSHAFLRLNLAKPFICSVCLLNGLAKTVQVVSGRRWNTYSFAVSASPSSPESVVMGGRNIELLLLIWSATLFLPVPTWTVMPSRFESLQKM